MQRCRSQVWVWVALAGLGACSGPPLEPGFESADPQERTAALLESARLDNERDIPELITLLNSSDPAERMLAGLTLRRLTGQNFGYRHYDPPLVRGRAVEAWRLWWLDHQGGAGSDRMAQRGDRSESPASQSPPRQPGPSP